jgi:hypothetical protein
MTSFLIPRSMEFDHVQSMLVHEFCHIQSIGIVPMELFQNVLSTDVFKKCQSKSQDLALPYIWSFFWLHVQGL